MAGVHGAHEATAAAKVATTPAKTGTAAPKADAKSPATGSDKSADAAPASVRSGAEQAAGDKPAAGKGAGGATGAGDGASTRTAAAKKAAAPATAAAPAKAAAPGTAGRTVAAAHGGEAHGPGGAAAAGHGHGAAATGGAAGEGAHGANGSHGPEIALPARNDPRFKAGTTGPVVKEGDAPTVKIPDGPGYGGEKGRKQNANDKQQNNYSVTDANFNPQLGLLENDPDSGKPLNYVQGIQMYNAAGYVRTFAPDAWSKLVENQNAGKGTILGGAAKLMGLVKTEDPSLEGVNAASIPTTIPGTNRDAAKYVMAAKDATGQEWARHHHPESAWDMYANLISAGVDGEKALRLAGDDGVSGSGRLNGYNNQDGNNSFNAGEVEAFKEGARLEQETGIPVVQIMMSGHDHTGLDASAKTKPNINKLLGLDPNDVSASPARAAAIRDALLDGAVNENNGNDTKAGGGNKAGAGAAAAAAAAGGGNGGAAAAAAGAAGGGNGGGAAAAGVQAAAAGNGGGATAAGGGGKAGGGGNNEAVMQYRAPSYAFAGEAGHHGPEIVNPARGDSRFFAGSTGPVVKEGEAPTLKIPDGLGFGGLEGRKQNAGDKAQNNYSVTDANFNPQLGILEFNPDTGEKLNYVQGIQMYNAAGYLAAFAPEVYAQLVANQNAGNGTILGAAAYIMGLVQTPDPALQGVDVAAVPMTIPGSPIDAKAYVMSTRDINGEEWARHHHPESAWDMYKNLVQAGLDWETAMSLAGDDGVSGSGRLNGYNNQDGNDSFNADEAAVFRKAAEIEQQTGIPVVQIMMSGHDHTGLDASAKTQPNINKLLGLDPADVSATPERAAAIAQALLAADSRINIGNVGKFTAKHDYILKANTGTIAPLPAPAPAGAAHGAAHGVGAMAGGVPAAGAGGPVTAGAGTGILSGDAMLNGLMGGGHAHDPILGSLGMGAAGHAH